MLENLRKTFSIGRKALLLIVAGSLAWALTMVKSGLRYDYGVGFWGPNGHDGVWHLSLARSLASGSLEMPIFAGEQIKNYHLGFDLLLALVNRITALPVSVLYFQIFPPIMAIFIGFLTYKFVLNWKKSQAAAFWSTFFVYFGGNLGWILTLLKGGGLGGESVFWAQPAILTLINPPYAMSLVFILLGLNLMIRLKIIPSAIVFGLLIQIKAYAGIILLGALLPLALYEYWKKHTFNYLKLLVISCVISFVIFLPNLTSGSLLEFKPFWFLETMMSFPDRVGWSQFGEAMVNYRLGGQWLKAFAAYGIALLIFWYGNLGTRFVDEFYWVKIIKSKKLELIDVFIGSAIVIGLLGAMLFVQKGTAWNTIQFYYYSLFFVSIIAGVVFAKIKTNLLVAGALIFMLPTTVGALKHYLPSRPPAMISNDELDALEFLSNQPKGVVLVMPFDRQAASDAADNPPRPLYLYESTAYVSAYSSQPVWLEDEVNLDITGYDWQARRKKLVGMLKRNNQSEMKEFLREENISYVYVVEPGNIVFEGLTKQYSENGVRIYKLGYN
ncbi:hypothetical protein A2803_02620 [Candidatus Woesebacteria bacterium RIFCSPHIGHO2_01_FULL_44_21]|uniref:Glycosyltransferase RgtA/B/C/D-like domain-containing protein n=1 Tax=Candidatus Woesebacteria bacterium RIFCSPHIGHO2_01_FULL_44_21 TaxID=1802503 RepID=A0A1F7YZ03_9BACT|nr:MAG: hypothetical protein A2803_02620 [Candidatus Woesebacteria bacterium RIFCSPHIGHO2_01_FULL_44_21]OGM69834.1 MAG: hypothetical protein A2897_00625 [Candidatus Woesebacteria bacterium RIFCSPLOWO2_01_FULL_44_24b]